MAVANWPHHVLGAPLSSPYFRSSSRKSISLSLRSEDFPGSTIFQLKFGPERSIKCSCRCVEDKHSALAAEDFSVLQLDNPWESGRMWSSFSLYLFSMHIPLSFGGLSVVARVLHQRTLDPQTEVLSLLVIQMLELSAILWLLRWIVKPEYKLSIFFQPKNQSNERNWLLASVLGFGFLVLLVLTTSLLADQLFGPKDLGNSTLKEILSSGSISVTACMLLYCVVTPLLEEIVYRRFLLTSLASEMKWHQAVILSSAIFSASHFSGENFLQLLLVGSVLGCSYCWTGNLGSSFVIHSMYNALILINTFLS
ncbi:hypothetical protein NMG60_11035571 [Bertholletia excelsa]